jgi:co-chaperonin GroES (HSP10)
MSPGVRRRDNNVCRPSIAVIAVAALVLLIARVAPVSSLSTPSGSKAKKYYGGAGVGRLVLDEKAGAENVWKTHYDMVLCERLQVRVEERDSGLFVPQQDLPRLHLCRVLSVGPGREEENGRIAPMPENLVPGAIVIAKNPWGIGPKDEETTDGKKLSYMRVQDICAVVAGGIVDE